MVILNAKSVHQTDFGLARGERVHFFISILSLCPFRVTPRLSSDMDAEFPKDEGMNNDTYEMSGKTGSLRYMAPGR